MTLLLNHDILGSDLHHCCKLVPASDSQSLLSLHLPQGRNIGVSLSMCLTFSPSASPVTLPVHCHLHHYLPKLPSCALLTQCDLLTHLLESPEPPLIHFMQFEKSNSHYYLNPNLSQALALHGDYHSHSWPTGFTAARPHLLLRS